MSQRFTVTALVARYLAGVAARAGVVIHDLLDAHGVSPQRLREPDARIPHELVRALWEELPRRLGDDAFGLHCAQELPHDVYDVVDLAMGHAPTLGESYRTFMRYQRLVHDAASFGLEEAGPVVRLVHIWPGSDPLPRHINEFVMAALLVRGRKHLRQEWAPLEVCFQHAAPADTREHQRLFRAPVRFGHPINEMTLDRALLERPIPVFYPELGAVLDRFAQVLLGNLPARGGFLDEVRRGVLLRLSTGPPEADVLARQLGLSKRSFFRRLQELGTSYQQVVDELRRDLTLRYLREGKLSLSEIAFALGYSEVSTFHRAFRRWMGQSPAEYRRSLASGSPPPPP